MEIRPRGEKAGLSAAGTVSPQTLLTADGAGTLLFTWLKTRLTIKVDLYTKTMLLKFNIKIRTS